MVNNIGYNEYNSNDTLSIVNKCYSQPYLRTINA